MRKLLLFLAPFLSFGLDNAIRFTATETLTGRPFDLHRVFANGEVCGYPQPFVNGLSPATWGTEVTTRWPATAACPAGPVKAAGIYFQADVTDTITYVIDFRDSADPCSSGNQAACSAAASILTAFTAIKPLPLVSSFFCMCGGARGARQAGR